VKNSIENKYKEIYFSAWSFTELTLYNAGKQEIEKIPKKIPKE
jgi:hypothetical protein